MLKSIDLVKLNMHNYLLLTSADVCVTYSAHTHPMCFWGQTLAFNLCIIKQNGGARLLGTTCKIII